MLFCMLAKAYWWIITNSESWPNPILKAPLCPPAVNLVRFSKTVPTKGQTVDNGRRSFSTWAIPIRTTPPFEKPPINLRQRVVSRTNRSGGSPGSLSRGPFTGHLVVSWNVNQGSGPVASIGGDPRAGALCGDGGCRLALAHLVNVSGAVVPTLRGDPLRRGSCCRQCPPPSLPEPPESGAQSLSIERVGGRLNSRARGSTLVLALN